MSKNNIIFIVIAIILIIICIAIKTRKNVNITNNTNEVEKSITYNEVINNENGKSVYIIYDENGKEKARVDEEYKLKIYELDPDYEEIPVENHEDL